MIFFSKATNGFYDSVFNKGNIPPDAVEITKEEHAALITAQSQGKTIQADAQGRPYAAFPEYTLEETKTNKLAGLAAYRFQKETAGMTLNGITIRTDRESQAMISGAKSYLDANPESVIDWKGANGWAQIDRATLLTIGQGVGAYVQACFSREQAHSAAIEALTTAEGVEAYDFTTGWPE
jgi:hypothetical protein